MTDNKNLIERFELVHETKRHKYYVSNYGYVLSVTSKSYKERKLTGYVKQGGKNAPYVIKLGDKEKCIKHLVAQAFIHEYKGADSNVFHKDGNKLNCRADNLIVVPKSQVAKITGPKSRSQAVIVIDSKGLETTFSSIRKAANNLNCSYQTLLDYMNGKSKKSVLSGFTITKIAEFNSATSEHNIA